MTATVEQIGNDFTALIRLAVGGEEIVITEGGQPIAKLTGLIRPSGSVDRAKWLESLRQLREVTTTAVKGRTADEILEEDRAGRD
jgi:antitoxin (DNA-binding transcriptional repressor) of toxin-antitoxin stability system